MNAAPKQLALLDDEEAAEIEAGYIWREQLYGACRAAVRELGGYEVAANALDKRWGGKGSGVAVSMIAVEYISTSLARVRINDVERYAIPGPSSRWTFDDSGRAVDPLVQAALDAARKRPLP